MSVARPLIDLPKEVRSLLDAPNYVHLATLRADGSPRSHVVWVGVEGETVLVCTSDTTWKAKDMRRDPRVSMTVVDSANPYRMAGLQGRVIEVRPDDGCRHMDPISVKYTGAPFSEPGPRPGVLRHRRREGCCPDTGLHPRSSVTQITETKRLRFAFGAATVPVAKRTRTVSQKGRRP